MGNKLKATANGKVAATKAIKAKDTGVKPSKATAVKPKELDVDSGSDGSAESSDESADDLESGSESESDSDASDDSEVSDDESEAESREVNKGLKTKTNGTAASKGAPAKAAETSDEDSPDDDSASDSFDDSEGPAGTKPDAKIEDTQEESPKKRKALDDPNPSDWAKKPKTEEAGESSTLFVGNLAWAVDDDKLYQTFARFDGLVGARVMIQKDTGRSRGFGYVDFSGQDAAAAALTAMQKHELEGRAINVDFSTSRASGGSDPKARANQRASFHNDTTSAESETLFVGNLPFDVDEDTIRQFFGEVAEVQSCRLPTDPDSGALKGFGYVTFFTVEDAKSALEAKHGVPIGASGNGRPCRLDFASSRPPRGGDSGRGGFGGRGGGRGGGGGRGRGRGGFKPQGKRTVF